MIENYTKDIQDYNCNYNLNFFIHSGASRRKHRVFHTAV